LVTYAIMKSAPKKNTKLKQSLKRQAVMRRQGEDYKAKWQKNANVFGKVYYFDDRDIAKIDDIW
jgi:predicted membrane protein